MITLGSMPERAGFHTGARWLLLLLAFLLIVSPVWAAPPAQTGGLNRAGLVVVHGDGRVVTRCVSFDEPQISGLALLQRSGLALDVSAGPMGVTVCTLNGEGCPASDCWCECKGTPCTYWNYFQQGGDGAWLYAAMGATARQVNPGDVDGWVWGDGSLVPPSVSLNAICGSAPPPATERAPSTESVATMTPVAATPTALLPTPSLTATPSPMTTTPKPSVTPTPSPTLPRTEVPATPTSQPAPTFTATPLLTATPAPMASDTPSMTPSATETLSPDNAMVDDRAPGVGLPPYAAFLLILGVLGGLFFFLRYRGSV